MSRGRDPRALPRTGELDADDQALLAQVIDYYHERLKQSPEALAYLERRGIEDRRSRSSASSWALPTGRSGCGCRRKHARRAPRSADGCRRLGLWRESGHEHFNGSIVIPVIAPTGEVTEVYGRKINDDLRPGTPLHLYLPGPHRGVWNEAALAAAPEIILCEALIDAMTFWCARLPQRHGQLRHRGLHRRSPGGLQALRHRSGC